MERRFRALARGRGLGGSVDPKVPAGGAVGAVLGGPGDGRALKREFIVFLKENPGFFSKDYCLLSSLNSPMRDVRGLQTFGWSAR